MDKVFEIIKQTWLDWYENNNDGFNETVYEIGKVLINELAMHGVNKQFAEEYFWREADWSDICSWSDMKEEILDEWQWRQQEEQCLQVYESEIDEIYRNREDCYYDFWLDSL
jgi:hypothetical protein